MTNFGFEGHFGLILGLGSLLVYFGYGGHLLLILSLGFTIGPFWVYGVFYDQFCVSGHFESILG